MSRSLMRINEHFNLHCNLIAYSNLRLFVLQHKVFIMTDLINLYLFNKVPKERRKMLLFGYFFRTKSLIQKLISNRKLTF